jgi:hypothetical protein
MFISRHQTAGQNHEKMVVARTLKTCRKQIIWEGR